MIAAGEVWLLLWREWCGCDCGGSGVVVTVVGVVWL